MTVTNVPEKKKPAEECCNRTSAENKTSMTKCMTEICGLMWQKVKYLIIWILWVAVLDDEKYFFFKLDCNFLFPYVFIHIHDALSVNLQCKSHENETTNNYYIKMMFICLYF